MGDLFLGFDLSTQSCKALVINKALEIECSAKVTYSEDLKEFNTENGIVRGKDGAVTSPTAMWVAALELCISRLRDQCDLSRIKAMSGSGQQHGVIFWKSNASVALAHASTMTTTTTTPSSSGKADERTNLVSLLKDAFEPMSPIWMDTSAWRECDDMEHFVGGPLELVRMTGSRAHTRFSAHLITQYFRSLSSSGDCIPKKSQNITDYERLSLVSSFGASLMCGTFVDIDASDGAGMNLMDITQRCWHPHLREYMENKLPGVMSLLGTIREPWTKAGRVSPYWHSKYGFSPTCDVIHWCGDNPSSVVGLGLREDGDLAISLGTSDTCLCVLSSLPLTPFPFGHIFPHPTRPGYYFAMLCYANGDLTRRAVRDEYAHGSWEEFADNISTKTVAGLNNQCALFLSTNEITPPIRKEKAPMRVVSDGTMREGPFSTTGTTLTTDAPFSPAAMNCRAVIEARALCIKRHLALLHHGNSSSTSTKNTTTTTTTTTSGNGRAHKRLLLTGGASVNVAIQQVFADVFQTTVATSSEVPDSAALGAAIRAAMGDAVTSDNDDDDDKYSAAARGLTMETAPKEGINYDQVLERYGMMEGGLAAQ